MQLDVVSDFVCPWCYVGKRRLEKALASRPELDISLRWLPFQLSPDMPAEGIDRREHYASIFGEQRAEQILSSMTDTGKEEGIDFANKPGAMSPNTLAAHVLMDYAQEAAHADADKLAELLFHAHHVDCADIGAPDVLVRLGEAAGLSAEEVRSACVDAQRRAKVQAAIQVSVSRGVTGVPFFIFADKYGMSGAQPVEEFIATFDQLNQKVSD
jgi:predicted DsbA family dithiol-disulfide isomerase